VTATEGDLREQTTKRIISGVVVRSLRDLGKTCEAKIGDMGEEEGEDSVRWKPGGLQKGKQITENLACVGETTS